MMKLRFVKFVSKISRQTFAPYSIYRICGHFHGNNMLLKLWFNFEFLFWIVATVHIHNFQGVKILRIEFWVVLCLSTTAGMAMTSRFMCDSVVWGHHASNDFWVTACWWRSLQCQWETSNRHDPFAVAILKDGITVGHVPRKYLIIPEKTQSYSIGYAKGQECKISWFKDYPQKTKVNTPWNFPRIWYEIPYT